MFCLMYDTPWKVDKDHIFGTVAWNKDRLQQLEKELEKMKELNAPKFLLDLINANLSRRHFMLEVLKQENENILNIYYR